MLKIPDRLLKKLEQDNDGTIKNIVATILNRFSQIYSENHIYFFNEYTDHGYRHVNSVLDEINKLITTESYKTITHKDVYVLIISILLHDLGMHIQPLTFKAMINGEYDSVIHEEMNDVPWKILWKNYLEEAKKFNESELKNIFGDSFFLVTIPDLENEQSLTEYDKKLIGEFIRRHHPRIAYEVAQIGLKSNDGKFIDLCDGMDKELRFLSGIVARSHGIDIRGTFEVLKLKFPGGIWFKPLDIFVIYLMVLLRIADYLQIDSSRILKIPYQTKSFKSPLSVFEHRKHFSIVNYQELPNDNETIFFISNPTNSLVYVSLLKLFNAIQKELDTSWAVLSEVYSKQSEKKLGIKYRRIKTNIDQPEWINSIKYVPEIITFSAEKELLNLLIAPLYGYNPSFGIRELLQNSIDACWEREIIENNLNHTYKGEIKINFQHRNFFEKVTFTIFDNGKGMKLEEIKNYFLKAGSSYKKSTDWRKKYLGENKTPFIHRIGRFGIGVLAAFLLGDEIYVETRHINSASGYRFTAQIENDNIEIVKAEDIQIGTKITILITESIRDALFRTVKDRIMVGKDEKYFDISLRWDKWFVLDNPKVEITIDNHPPFEPYNNPCPQKFRTESDWRKFMVDKIGEIHWTFDNTYTRNYLTCNGIVIPNSYELSNKINNTFFSLKKPFINVYDYKEGLQLDLNRNRLFEKYLPFEEILISSVFDDIIKQLILTQPLVENDFVIAHKENEYDFNYSGFTNTYMFLYSNAGYTINLAAINSSIFNLPIYKENPSLIILSVKNLKYHTKIKLTNQLICLKNDNTKTSAAIDYFLTESMRLERPRSSVNAMKYIKNHIIPYNNGNKKLSVQASTSNLVKNSILSPIEKEFLRHYKKIIGESLFIPFDNKEKIRNYKSYFPNIEEDIKKLS